MGRRFLTTISILIALWLLYTPLSTAQSNMPEDQSGPRRQMEPPNIRRHRNGFDGANQRVNVSGTINITKSINLALTIKPTDEVLEKMSERAAMHLEDFQNVISVSLTKLVEYEDASGDGLTNDDLIVSSFLLSEENLQDVTTSETDGETIYSIVSNDGSFQMIIEINSTNDMPHDWKWSLIISYDYLSDTSKLAVLHDITIGRGDLIRERFANSSAHPEEFEQRELSRSHLRVPMFFRWDRDATVDGTDVDVEATKYNDSLSLSFLQGETIEYDPSIGASPESIESMDFELSNIFESVSVDSLLDQISSPTARGLMIASLITATIAIGTLIRRTRTK